LLRNAVNRNPLKGLPPHFTVNRSELSRGVKAQFYPNPSPLFNTRLDRRAAESFEVFLRFSPMR